MKVTYNYTVLKSDLLSVEPQQPHTDEHDAYSFGTDMREFSLL